MTDVDFRAVSGKRFVDGIVDNFVDQVVKSVDARRADVHGRALPNGLKPFENLNLVRAVGWFRGVAAQVLSDPAESSRSAIDFLSCPVCR